MLKKFFQFISESRSELSKCSWPWASHESGLKRYKELKDSTIVVVTAMLFMGAYIAFFDLILINIVAFLTKQ